jgi:integrin beta 3
MVLGPQGPGRVGRRRSLPQSPSPPTGWGSSCSHTHPRTTPAPPRRRLAGPGPNEPARPARRVAGSRPSPSSRTARHGAGGRRAGTPGSSCGRRAGAPRSAPGRRAAPDAPAARGRRAGAAAGSAPVRRAGGAGSHARRGPGPARRPRRSCRTARPRAAARALETERTARRGPAGRPRKQNARLGAARAIRPRKFLPGGAHRRPRLGARCQDARLAAGRRAVPEGPAGRLGSAPGARERTRTAGQISFGSLGAVRVGWSARPDAAQRDGDAELGREPRVVRGPRSLAIGVVQAEAAGVTVPGRRRRPRRSWRR